jgi:hypothetical protein
MENAAKREGPYCKGQKGKAPAMRLKIAKIN